MSLRGAGLRWAIDPLAPAASAYVGVAPYGGVDPASPDDDLLSALEA